MVLKNALFGLALATSAWAVATPVVSNATAVSIGDGVDSAVASPESTAAALSGDVSYSIINRNITSPDIPDHVNLMVKNCTTSGTLSLIAGGYYPDETEIEMAIDFFDSGYLEFQANGLAANVSIEMSLLSGYQNASFKLPVTTQHLLDLPLAGFANIGLDLEIALPISANLDAQADMFLGFLLSVPDGASIFLNVGNPSSSYVTGFNESTLTPLPFDVNTPNTAFTALTGLEFTLTANASTTNSTQEFDTSAAGDVVITMDLPVLRTTVAPVSNVNDACEPATGSEQSFDHAVNVLWEAHLDLSAEGQYVADIDGTGKSFSPPTLEIVNNTFPLPSQCFKWSPTSTGLAATTAAPSSEPSPSAHTSSSECAVAQASVGMMTVFALVATFVSLL